MIGAGVMGRGIAHEMAAAGISVLLSDASDGAAAAAVSELRTAWEAQATKGRSAAAFLHPRASGEAGGSE